VIDDTPGQSVLFACVLHLICMCCWHGTSGYLHSVWTQVRLTQQPFSSEVLYLSDSSLFTVLLSIRPSECQMIAPCIQFAAPARDQGQVYTESLSSVIQVVACILKCLAHSYCRRWIRWWVWLLTWLMSVLCTRPFEYTGRQERFSLPTLTMSVGVGRFSSPSVCLSVCLFIRSIIQQEGWLYRQQNVR